MQQRQMDVDAQMPMQVAGDHIYPCMCAHTERNSAYLGLLEACIHAWLEVPQVTEHTLLELLHIPHRSSKRFEAKN